jgi:hypothetical protein
MILDNNQRDYLSTREEDNTRMSISSDVESHIIKVLTEYSYDDPLGSSIREAVSNAIDSTTEAGTNEPVLVQITKNAANQNVLSITDKGLGLDDVSFKKYIMGIGESTKRNNDKLLGGFGAGAKAWLAYTSSFTFLCRKDGIERKYLIFKGEEFPECNELYNRPTTEPNGVTVEVTLPNNWNELTTCTNKINEQLSYLDNVYYNIPGFDNTRKIYRHEHFQYVQGTVAKKMHISLKNIYYPIPWDKLGMTPIEIPIALRFDDYSEIKPIFNRENIQVNAQALRAIKEKIAKVADYFVTEWNQSANKFETLRHAYNILRSNRWEYKFQDTKFYLNDLISHASIPLIPAKVEGIDDNNLSLWVNEFDHILSAFSVRYRAEKHGSSYVFKDGRHAQSFIYNIRAIDCYSHACLIDFVISPKLKAYMKDKFKTTTYLVGMPNPVSIEECLLKIEKKTSTKIPTAVLRKELETIIAQFASTFTDWRGLDTSKEFLDWIEVQKAAIKAGAAAGPVYMGLNKQKGEVTVYTARPHKITANKEVVWDKSSKEPEDLSFWKGLTVVSVKSELSVQDEKYIQPFIHNAGKCKHLRFLSFNPSEYERAIEKIQNKVTLKQFIKMKPLTRLATALYIQELQQTACSNYSLAAEAFREVQNSYQALMRYKTENIMKVEKDVAHLIIKNAFVNNDWDFSIYAEVQKYKKFIQKFGFLRLFDRYTNTYSQTASDKRLLTNMMFIMLKHQKIQNALIEDYHLTKDEETADCTEQAIEVLNNQLVAEV